MVVLMIGAACYGVLQLALLASATRTVRVTTLLLAVLAGGYACGLLTLISEIGYTRLVRAITGDSLYEVVKTASHTVDPVIEEVVKVLPLLLIAWLARRHKFWGVTDFVLLGAAIGTGFALMEALLRFSDRAAQALGDGSGGFIILRGLFPPHVAGVGPMLGSWLPPPIRTELLGLASAPTVNYHLVWSALAGLGLGLLVRMKGWWRLLGLAPLLYASIDHAVNNYTVVNHPGGLLSAAEAVRNVLPIFVLVGLVLAIGIDLFLLRTVKGAHPELLTEAERNGRNGLLVLGRFAFLAPPWTIMIAIRFALARRSVRYARAALPDQASPLEATVIEIAELIDHASIRKAWQTQAVRDAMPQIDLGKTIANWRVLLWLILGVPVFLYFVAGALPPTSGLQKFMASPVIFPAVAVLTLVGLAYGIWQLTRMIMMLRRRDHGGWGEAVLRTGLRISIGVAAVIAGVGALLRWITGTAGDEGMINNLHILEALGSALLIVGILMALASLFIMFPPGGALVLVGGGTLGSGVAIAGILKIAAVLGLSGIALMAAAKNRKSSDGLLGGGAPRNHRAQNKQAESAIRSAERQLGRLLREDEKDRVHRMISKQGFTRDEVIDLILSEFG